MKKKGGLLKSVSICLVVAVLMLGAGFFLLAGESPSPQTGGKVEAAWISQDSEEKNLAEEAKENDQEEEVKEQNEESSIADQKENEQEVDQEENEKEVTVGEDEVNQEVIKENEDVITDNSYASNSSEESNNTVNSDQVDENEELKDNPEPKVVQSNSTAKGDPDPKQDNNKQEEEPKPAETTTEAPSSTPAPVAEKPKEEIKEEPKPEVQSVSVKTPVTYTWGSAGSYIFRMEVSVTNNGSSPSSNVSVAVPLLENSSPYQETTLRSANYNIISTSGRVSTFDLGDIAPGETKTIRADFDIRVRPVAISSTNDTVEKARQAYEMYAGSGNCRTLARAFINKCREMGINAREVIGFARPQRGAMTSGSLAGCRHSWAEFEVPGLGWVPVDLTFQYFGELPQTSHVVESYSDQSIKVNFSGGSLSATWSNLIL